MPAAAAREKANGLLLAFAGFHWLFRSASINFHRQISSFLVIRSSKIVKSRPARTRSGRGPDDPRAIRERSPDGLRSRPRPALTSFDKLTTRSACSARRNMSGETGHKPAKAADRRHFAFAAPGHRPDLLWTSTGHSLDIVWTFPWPGLDKVWTRNPPPAAVRAAIACGKRAEGRPESRQTNAWDTATPARPEARPRN